MPPFHWTSNVEDAKQEQRTIKELLSLETGLPPSLSFNTGLAIGCSYEENTGRAFAVGVFFDETGSYSTDKRELTADAEVDFPYTPGLLAFRVGPAICRLLDQVSEQVDVLLFDGQGIAHKRGLGLASHIGILYNKPSIGVTRHHLFGNFSHPPTGKLSSTPITHPQTHRTIGYALCLGDNCEPCFVSAGHRISVKDSLSFVCKIAGEGCFPRPLNRAHTIANATARKFYESRRN